MNYLNEMEDEHGFNNGKNIPCGIELFRKAYIIAINHHSELLGSDSRIIAIDRLNTGNWCSVFYIHKKETKYFSDEDFFLGEEASIKAISSCGSKEYKDPLIESAIKSLRNLNIDTFIDIKASLLEDDLNQALIFHKKIG